MGLVNVWEPSQPWGLELEIVFCQNYVEVFQLKQTMTKMIYKFTAALSFARRNKNKVQLIDYFISFLSIVLTFVIYNNPSEKLIKEILIIYYGIF